MGFSQNCELLDCRNIVEQNRPHVNLRLIQKDIGHFPAAIPALSEKSLQISFNPKPYSAKCEILHPTRCGNPEPKF
jgi:hypothetical protein